MDNLISRKWLMECVNEGWIKFDTQEDENRFTHLVRDIAPSAELKRGYWIKTGDKEETYGTVYKCSVCGVINYEGNFCPNCGADMRGEHDG